MAEQMNKPRQTQLFSMSDISIKTKLIILSAISMLFLSLVLASASISYVTKALIDTEYKILTATRDSKIKQLQSMFDRYKKQITLLADTDYVQNLTLEFTDIHNSFDIKTAEKFPIFSDKVTKILPKWDKFYKKYTQVYPFDDVYIVCAAHGHVMYSYKKYPDFGENLEHGNYRKSGLAQIWRKVKKYKRTVFIDMSAYEPRGGEPSMFIAAPIFVKGVFKSVLIFRLKNENIKNIMQLRSGYGKTQEDYIVGKDYLMRSDSYLSPQTHSVINSFKNVSSGKVESIAVKKAFQNITNTEIITDYNDNKVLSAYTLFNIDDDLNWAVISEIDLAEVLIKPNQLQKDLLVIILSIFGIVMVLYYYFIQKYIIISLNEFQQGLFHFFDYINGKVDQVQYLNNFSKDEIGTMSIAVNKSIEKTKKRIEKKQVESWIKNGINELNRILASTNSLEEVTNRSIDFLGNYTNAGVAVLYLYNEDEKKLLQYSHFAQNNENNFSTEYLLGEGIAGQVALQKSPILLNNETQADLTIRSATHTDRSYTSYTFPLVYNEILYGVIEIGSAQSFTKKKLELLNSVDKTICISLLSAIHHNQVTTLLSTAENANTSLTQKQAELEETNKRMQEQQQELEEANVNMEEQQQELEEANANMEEQQQQLKISEQSLTLQNQQLVLTQQEIQKKADELEQSGKYKSEFLSNMSHELRTPLNAIILLSSLLHKNTKKTLTEDDRKKAKTIFESGNELLRLINDILDLSKVESGKMEVIVDSFESGMFLEQMKDFFDCTAHEKGLEFIIIDKYKNTIHSDKDRISQIIRNLISNAFKFTSQGSITLKIMPSKKSTQDIEFSVIDTGIGIPLVKQEIIFKAFTQADGSTSREYGGTGLGLSISREFTKLLGGEIEVVSTEGKGSTFSIDLPLLKPLQKEHHRKISRQHTALQPTPTFNTNSKVEILDDRKKLTHNEEAYLIIDDDTIFTEIVYEEITKSGSYGLVAHDAKSGLQLVEQYNIKGIMLDLTLPDMDGVDVLKELKSNNHSKNIPVHVISSKDKNTQTLELGAIGYLQKPVFDGEIIDVITNIDNFKKNKIKNLLIVENDTLHREALVALVGDGVKIKGVNTASEAIHEIRKLHYNTVIIDLDLINRSGYEVCEYIKNSHPNLPIIIYTSKDLSKEEKIQLQKYTNSIIIKTEHSNERILSEINLFLQQDQQPKKNTQDVPFHSVDLNNSNILLVDDDIKNIFVLEAALEEFNANTHTAFNGQEALDFLAKDNNIDLILMDIMMPVMDGYETIQNIRNNDLLKHIPIIAVTAKAMKEDREKCILVGADDYISKPINPNILGGLMQQWSLKQHI